jgi:hypothetical protein
VIVKVGYSHVSDGKSGFITYFIAYSKALDRLSMSKRREGGFFKSPFSKGGLRGIIRRLYNPPYPPLEKGGDPTANKTLLDESK